MPVITALEPARGRGGFDLHIDGDLRCRISRDLCVRYGLAPGLELESRRVEAIVQAANLAAATDAALSYLSYRPRTSAEVLRHLRKRGHAACAAPVLARCVELGYVDDDAYAVAFARERLRLRPRGRSRIVSELLTRGVPRETAERGVAKALEEEGVTEDELLRRLALGRLPALRGLGPGDARRRLAAYLRRRGFRSRDVWSVIRDLLPEAAAPDQD